MELKSPAKINLFLKVLKKRDDGFHEVSTLMQAVSLFDTLSIEKAPRFSLTCDSATLPCDSTNLVAKAHKLFETKFGAPAPSSIHLSKKIPQEAGLGGGSSNAATTLFALNALFGKPFQEEQLAIFAAELGSDVPFFFTSGRALCKGRGEICLPQPKSAPQVFSLFLPPFRLSTKQVYQKAKPSSSFDEEKALFAIQKNPPEFFNDLEEAAMMIRPEMQAIKESKAASFTMSGSGSAFFTLGEHPGSSFQVFSTFREEGSWYQ